MPEFQIIRGGRLVETRAHTAHSADVLVEGDTIREIGPPGLAAPAGATVIDAAGKLLHPGLINAHTHGHGNLAKGMGDRWTLELLLAAGPWITGNRTPEEKHLATLIGAAEMVLKGTTAAYDLFVEFPTPSAEGLAATAQAYAEVGMRATIAPMVADTTLYEAIPGLMEALTPALRKDVEKLRMAPADTTLAAIRDGLRSWRHDRDQLQIAVAPTIPLHCRDEFMAACGRLAEEFGVGMHSHVGESKVQAVAGIRRYGKTLIAHMDALGLVGPRFVAAHAVWLDDDDFRRMAAKGASIAHNPGSNMRLGNGLANMRGMLDLGVNVGIGTDGASCADNLNMYEAMRLASFASKVQGPDPRKWVTTEEVLTAATEGSARALGFDKLGKIAPGYKADIVFLDLGAVNWLPLNDATNQLVHTEDATAVESVMIGGRMIVEKRRLLTLDVSRLAAKVEAARERLAAVNAPNKALYERLEGVVGSFCPALAKTPYHIHRYCGLEA
jgi:5-methylthioadenosine/S-adenosylhomocysteine deaminase